MVKCNICGQEFDSERGLKSHKGQKHKDEESKKDDKKKEEYDPKQSINNLLKKYNMNFVDSEKVKGLMETGKAKLLHNKLLKFVEKNKAGYHNLYVDGRRVEVLRKREGGKEEDGTIAIMKGEYKFSEKFKNSVLQLLGKGGKANRNKATEKMAEKIQEKYHLHTTRDDEKNEVWMYVEGVYKPNGKSYIKEMCREILGEAYTIRIAKNVINKIETETYIEKEEFFKEDYPEKIPVQNGILNIKTKTLEPFHPDYKFFNKINARFLPNKDCPKIKEFMDDILKGEEDKKLIQEMFGVCLYKKYWKKAFILSDKEDKIWIGNSGKSTLLNLLKNFLGAENCVNIPLQELNKDFAKSELFKRMACIGGDISKKSIKESGAIKELTGGEMISADRKWKTRVHFVNYAKLIFSCNKIPITYDETEAFISRWSIVEFPFTFLNKKDRKDLDLSKEEMREEGVKKADKNIIDEITKQDELDGLLNWALGGLHRLWEQGHFTESDTTKERRKKWIRKSDSFRAFCMDCVEQEFKSKMTKKILRKVYNQYCSIHNIENMGDRHIKESLNRNLGVTDGQVGSEGWIEGRPRVWEGIRFNITKLRKEGIKMEIEDEVNDNKEEEGVVNCFRCGERYPKELMKEHNENKYCKDCFKKQIGGDMGKIKNKIKELQETEGKSVAVSKLIKATDGFNEEKIMEALGKLKKAGEIELAKKIGQKGGEKEAYIQFV